MISFLGLFITESNHLDRSRRSYAKSTKARTTMLKYRCKSSPSFARSQTSLVSTSLPAHSCVTPSTSPSVGPSSISASLIEPAEWSQRTTISRMQTTSRRLFASFVAAPAPWTRTNSASILLSHPSTTLAPLHGTLGSKSRSERTHTTRMDSRSGSP